MIHKYCFTAYYDDARPIDYDFYVSFTDEEMQVLKEYFSTAKDLVCEPGTPFYHSIMEALQEELHKDGKEEYGWSLGYYPEDLRYDCIEKEEE